MIFFIALAIVIIVVVRSHSGTPSDSCTAASLDRMNETALGEPDGVFDDEFDTNPYLIFDGVLSPDTPRDFLPLMDTIRRESEWRRVFGSRLTKDRDGNYGSIVVKGYYYGFSPVMIADRQQQAAIASGKKLAYRPEDVATWVLGYGFVLDDFALIPDEYAHYVRALQSAESGDIEEAIKHATSAAQARPDEAEYADLVADLKLRTGDTTGIDDAVSYYENDMDCAVHSGTAHGWLRALAEAGRFAQAASVLERVDALLGDLVEGKRENRIYGAQSTEFVAEKRDQFRQGLGLAVDLGKSVDLSQEDVDLESLAALCRAVLKYDTTPKARIFAQRCADAFAARSDTVVARELYEAALALARAEQKPRVIGTLEKRLASL